MNVSAMIGDLRSLQVAAESGLRATMRHTETTNVGDASRVMIDTLLDADAAVRELPAGRNSELGTALSQAWEAVNTVIAGNAFQAQWWSGGSERHIDVLGVTTREQLAGLNMAQGADLDDLHGYIEALATLHRNEWMTDGDALLDAFAAARNAGSVEALEMARHYAVDIMSFMHLERVVEEQPKRTLIVEEAIEFVLDRLTRHRDPEGADRELIEAAVARLENSLEIIDNPFAANLDGVRGWPGYPDYAQLGEALTDLRLRELIGDIESRTFEGIRTTIAQ